MSKIFGENCEWPMSSDDIAKQNNVSVSQVLDSIHVWHLCQVELGVCGHFHIELHSDGSGVLLNTRFNFKYDFNNLKQFVQKSKQMWENHKKITPSDE